MPAAPALNRNRNRNPNLNRTLIPEYGEYADEENNDDFTLLLTTDYTDGYGLTPKHRASHSASTLGLGLWLIPPNRACPRPRFPIFR